MKISLSPQRNDTTLSIAKHGDILTINGEAFDFTDVPNGASVKAEAIECPFITGNVDRTIDGELLINIVLPHGPNPPEHVAFPVPLEDVQDGTVELPKADEPVEDTDVEA